MTVNPLLRPLGIAAAILGTLQGLLWTVLSLLVILLSTDQWVPVITDDQYFQYLSYFIFFKAPDGTNAEIIFTGAVVLGFAIFYLTISFVWTVSSLTLTWVFFREKYDHARLSTFTWCGVTGVMTIMDVVLMTILAIDLSTVQNSIGLLDSEKFILLTIFGTVMTIVARGYVLLILHAVLSFFLYKLANEISPTQQKSSANDNRPYNAYQDSTPAFSWYTNDNVRRLSLGKEENHNAGFIGDDSSLYHRSISQEPQSPVRRFIPPPANNVIPGRPQKTKAPVAPRDPGPIIPPPDYDNPKRELERMPRSALKNRSHY